jgi:UDP-N-acetylmuramoyl-tripeptide--D-alanyl-D-alanine ligase
MTRHREREDTMELLTLGDVVDLSEGELISRGGVSPTRKFSIDSRSAGPGDVFIAVKGRNFDGHDYIAEALSKGVSVIIAERMPSLGEDINGKNFILVKDSIEAMGKMAGKIRRSFGIPLICVTGTNGKTTVKDLTACALSPDYKVLKSRDSYNNVFGVSLTLFEMNGSHQAAVLEAGTNSPGEIAYLGEICAPDIVIITNIGRGHLQALGNKKGVLAEKSSMIGKLSPKGLAIINGDDKMLSGLKVPGGRILYYGCGNNCDIRIGGIEAVSTGMKFFVDGEKYFLPYTGRHNVHNAAAAIAAARSMGVGTENIRQSMEKASQPGMRLEKISYRGITFLNDAYNANPESFTAAVGALAAMPSRGEKWVVAGDMGELGGAARELHRDLGRKIAKIKPDFLITIGELAREILAEARVCGMEEKRTYEAFSHGEAASKIREKAPIGSTVLVKGSRVMKMEEVIRCFTI